MADISMRSVSPRVLVGSVAQLAVSAILITWAVSQVELGSVDSRLGDAKLGLIAVAFAGVGIQAALAAVRWRLVNRGLEVVRRYRWHLKAFLVGLFFSQVLPSTLGGDAYRLWTVARAGYGYRTGTLSVICDRALGLGALLVLAALTLPLLRNLIGSHQAFWVLVVVVSVGLAGFAVMVGVVPALTGMRLLAFLTVPATALRRVLVGRRLFTVHLAMGLAIHFLSVVVMILLARGLAIDLPWPAALALVPPVVLLSTLPISIAGWGVREGAMITGFALIGLGATDALVLSVSFGLLNLVVGLVGAAVWISSGCRAMWKQEEIRS